MVQQKLLHKYFSWVIVLIMTLVVLVSPAIASAQSSSEPVAIEWLKFHVPATEHARFIERDSAIWTPVLSSYSGFQNKEIWTNPDQPDELIIVTHWESFEQWQAIPQDVLDRTTQQFHQALGKEYPPESKGFRLAWRSNL